MSNSPVYVEIIRENHVYTATVYGPKQLENYCAQIREPFRIGQVSGNIPDANEPGGRWLLRELRSISRFGQNQNVTSTLL